MAGGVGDGVGGAVGVAVGVADGVGVGVGEGVAVGVGVGIGVDVGVATGERTGVALGVGATVGVGAGADGSPPHAASSTATNAAMLHREITPTRPAYAPASLARATLPSARRGSDARSPRPSAARQRGALLRYTGAMPVFPSVEWFQEAADRLNRSDSFARLGSCDAVMGVRVGERRFTVTFAAFAVTAVAEEAGDPDFTLAQPPAAWRAMLENIRANGRAEALYTLNSLDLRGEEEFATGEDYTRRDLFYRYNQTFQDYFDTSAHMETTFA